MTELFVGLLVSSLISLIFIQAHVIIALLQYKKLLETLLVEFKKARTDEAKQQLSLLFGPKILKSSFRLFVPFFGMALLAIAPIHYSFVQDQNTYLLHLCWMTLLIVVYVIKKLK